MVRSLISIFLVFSLCFKAQAALVTDGVGSAALAGVSVNLAPTAGPTIADGMLGTWFGLDCSELNPTSGRFFSCYKNGTQYKVSSGKTAWCTGLYHMSSGASQQWQFVDDSDTFDNAAALSSGNYQSGASAAYSMVSSPTANQWTNEPGFLIGFAQNRWVGVQLQNGTSNNHYIRISCREN